MSLVARYLEENGLPTVVMGTARDIVEHCGVARFLFADFPLGNPCGVPFDAAMQREIVGIAIDLLAEAQAPRTTVVAPIRWPEGDRWKELIFSESQPFLEGKVQQDWLKGKERYRKLKAEGKI